MTSVDSARTLNRLALVLPRYGANLGGGAETLARALVLALGDPLKNPAILTVQEVEVWTTCALDHRTWENALPAGVTVEDGLTVRRFPVDERNLEPFIFGEHALLAGRPLSVNQQLAWLAGGVNSAGLYAHIAREGASFDALIFAPYLFPTTFWGSLIHPERSLVIPCLHNEAYAYQEVFRAMFQRVRGLIFNAEPERTLAASIFGSETVVPKSEVVGMGFEPGPEPSFEKSRSETPFILYSGRKEQGKNLDKLIDWFASVRESLPTVELRIIGAGEIHFLRELPPGVVDLGFVSSEEKQRLMKDAVALCQPSINESFSIVMMEAWLQGTPVIVHSASDVTRDHVIRSGGGLHVSNAAELRGAVQLLTEDANLCTELARAGRRYVETEYAWTAVVSRFASLLERCGFFQKITDAVLSEGEHAGARQANC